MSHVLATRTFSQASPVERLSALRGVLLYTVVGLAIASVSGVISALAIAPVILSGGMFGMIIILAAMYGGQFMGIKLASGPNPHLGLLVGSTLMGVAMGPMLYVAWLFGLQGAGNGFALIGQAMGLTVLTAVGMLGYVWTEKRDFSLLRAGLSAMILPMIALMVIGLFFPSAMGTGGLGLVFAGAFVLFSAGALLYELNNVVHSVDNDRVILASFMLTVSILVLFWNILSLLMRLQGRD